MPVTSTLARCDFCGRPEVPWVVPCPPFAVLFAPGLLRSCDRNWLGCDVCTDLVRRRDRAALVERCVRTHYAIRDAEEAAVLRYIDRAARVFTTLFSLAGEPYPTILGGCDPRQTVVQLEPSLKPSLN